MPPSATLRTQVAVIGGGPGGYAAAFHAADHGLRVVLIDEREAPGGVCLNVGCIPSKALLRAAHTIEEARRAAAWGIAFGEPTVNLAALRTWKDAVVGGLTGGVRQLCKSRGVEFVRGRAVFVDSERVRLEDSSVEMVEFEHAILACGSSPATPAAFASAGPRVMNSTGALALEDVPARLLVVGGGYIGLEMATVYSALGSRVTVVEMTDGLLPGADRDLVRPVAAAIKERCAEVLLSRRVAAIDDLGDRLKVRIEDPSGAEPPREEEFERALVAVGRRPNSRGIGLENTLAKIDERGFVRVDRARRTDDPRIYAIGDVAGEPMLAHKASAEGRVAAQAIAGEPAAFEPAAIPAVVFTDPELAWAGLTEAEAKRDGIEILVSRFPWGASGRALTMDRKDGMTKLICEPGTERVLGVGIVGPGAGELIAEGALAIEMGALARDVAETIHAHPTLGETVMEAGELIFGSATHLYKPRKK